MLVPKNKEFELFDINDPLIAAYFDSREHKAHYVSLKHVDTRRRAHKALTNSFTNFLSLAHSTEAELKINKLFFSKITTKDSSGQENKEVADLAKEIDPESSKLLGIGNTLDFETLKSLYKKAAKRYHPDLGGSHEEMLSVNVAYTEFHHLLCEYEEKGGVIDEDEEDQNDFEYIIKSINDYKYVLSILLLKVYLDDWAIDSAFNLVKEIKNHHFWNYKPSKYQESNLFSLLKELWLGLRKAGMVLESSFIHSLIGDLFFPNKKNLRGDSYKSMLDKAVLRFSPTHLICVENAYRLKIINIEQYNKYKNKFEQQEYERIEEESKLQKFLKSYQFIPDLPSDAKANKLKTSEKLTPEPGYFEHDILNLSKAQQAEYFKAFSSKTTISLIEKYLFVRMRSYLESVIVYYNKNLLTRCIKECNRLLSLLGNHNWLLDVTNLLSYFAKLDKNERKKRLLILKTLHEKYRNVEYVEIRKGYHELPESVGFVITVSYLFLERARFPLFRLQKDLERGAMYLNKKKKL